MREEQKNPHNPGADRPDNGHQHGNGGVPHTAHRSRKQIHQPAQEIRDGRIGEHLDAAPDHLRVGGVDGQDFRSEEVGDAAEREGDADGQRDAVDKDFIHTFVISNAVILACKAHARLRDGVDGDI